MNSLTIIKPDDWHIHLREGDMMKAVLESSSRITWPAIFSSSNPPAEMAHPRGSPASAATCIVGINNNKQIITGIL